MSATWFVRLETITKFQDKIVTRATAKSVRKEINQRFADPVCEVSQLHKVPLTSQSKLNYVMNHLFATRRII